MITKTDTNANEISTPIAIACCFISVPDKCEDDDEVENIFAPKLINVTINAVPNDPAITRPKFMIAVP